MTFVSRKWSQREFLRDPSHLTLIIDTPSTSNFPLSFMSLYLCDQIILATPCDHLLSTILPCCRKLPTCVPSFFLDPANSLPYSQILKFLSQHISLFQAFSVHIEGVHSLTKRLFLSDEAPANGKDCFPQANLLQVVGDCRPDPDPVFVLAYPRHMTPLLLLHSIHILVGSFHDMTSSYLHPTTAYLF